MKTMKEDEDMREGQTFEEEYDLKKKIPKQFLIKFHLGALPAESFIF